MQHKWCIWSFIFPSQSSPVHFRAQSRGHPPKNQKGESGGNWLSIPRSKTLTGKCKAVTHKSLCTSCSTCKRPRKQDAWPWLTTSWVESAFASTRLKAFCRPKAWLTVKLTLLDPPILHLIDLPLHEIVESGMNGIKCVEKFNARPLSLIEGVHTCRECSQQNADRTKLWPLKYNFHS